SSEVYVAVPVVGNPSNTLLWRYDRTTGTLQRVLDDTGGFPVRFVALAGLGMTFSGVETTGPRNPDDPDEVVSCATDPLGCGPSAGLKPSGVPITLELRGHYGRLMMLTGVEFSYGLVQGGYVDKYQTNGNPLQENKLRERQWNRLIYGGVGAVLGKDAAIGF